MATEIDKQNARIIGGRGGDNEPLSLKRASWDHHRSIRVWVAGEHLGLATTTYSYGLTQDERAACARRLAALWNLAAGKGWSTEQIETLARQSTKEG